MATTNPFDLLGESENDDLSLLIAAQQKKLASLPSSQPASTPTVAKLPSKPLPPAQAVRESTATGRRGRGGRGGLVGQSRDFDNGGFGRNGDVGGFAERGRGGSGQYRGAFRGGRRGGHLNGEGEVDPDRPQRRVFERRSGTGIGFETKKEGAGRGNWGTVADEVVAQLRYVCSLLVGRFTILHAWKLIAFVLYD